MTRAERRRALREGQEVAVSELEGVNPAPKRPYRALMLGWNRHGAVKIYPLQLHAGNEVFLGKMTAALETVRRVMGIPDPTPYELGVFLGQNGGPLSPMDTALAAIAGWAEVNGHANLGEDMLGSEGVLTLATILRDVLGGLFIGARSRGGESLIDEALEEMRQLPKAKRF
jgi:hypothetical protein